MDEFNKENPDEIIDDNETAQHNDVEIEVENEIEIEVAQTSDITPENATTQNIKAAAPALNIGKEIFEWVYTILIAIVIAVVVKAFIFDVVKVDGESMYPTLKNADRLIVTKLGYKPEMGDIIILDSAYVAREQYIDDLEESRGVKMNFIQKFSLKFNAPDYLKEKFYVKRVIALPGQTIDIKDGKVFLDGVELNESYYEGKTFKIDSRMEFPATVPDDCVFVMGDNRGHSKDSRSSELGFVPYKAVMGKSQFRILPVNAIGLTK